LIPAQALIFDMDGLLIDTETLWYEATRRLLEPYGYAMSEEEFLDWVGVSVGVRELLDRYPLPLDEEEARRQYVEHFEALVRSDLRLMPGVREFLDTVAVHFGRAIASSTSLPWIDHLLTRARIIDRFPVRVSAKDLPRGKPAPDVFLAAAERLGVDPAACVVFEDAEPGVAGAKAAGMRAVAVPNQFTAHLDFLAADLVVGRITEVSREWLEGRDEGMRG